MRDINSEPATSRLESGNVCSYDAAHKTYVNLLNTGDMLVGTETLSVTLDDGTVRQITVHGTSQYHLTRVHSDPPTIIG